MNWPKMYLWSLKIISLSSDLIRNKLKNFVGQWLIMSVNIRICLFHKTWNHIWFRTKIGEESWCKILWLSRNGICARVTMQSWKHWNHCFKNHDFTTLLIFGFYLYCNKVKNHRKIEKVFSFIHDAFTVKENRILVLNRERFFSRLVPNQNSIIQISLPKFGHTSYYPITEESLCLLSLKKW